MGGTKHQQSNDTVSDPKKRRKVGFTQPDEGVQPNDVIKIFIDKGNGIFSRWKKVDPNICTIRLINKTRHSAAFKVLTVPYFVMRYNVTPSTGIVKPGSTYEVSVSIQEEKLDSPVEFSGAPKFAIFSTVISKGEDITSETFLNEGTKKVWLKVIDVVHE